MKQIEERTYITDQIHEKEWEYTYGSKKDEMVDFTFSNTKTWKENTKYKAFTYRKALDLA